MCVSVPNCSTFNFFQCSKSAIKLAKKLCECPEANAVLKTLSSPIFVDTGNFPHTHSTSNKINISNKDIKNKSGILSLIFEIFNIKKNEQFENLYVETETGKLPPDQFVEAMERLEIGTNKNSTLIAEKCQDIWKTNLNVLQAQQISNSLTEDELLWIQKTECHSDMIYIRWIENFQKSYCQVHPENTRACSLSVNDFCNLHKISALPTEERLALLYRRACDDLSHASDNIKSIYKPALIDVCPEKYQEENNHLYLILGGIALTILFGSAAFWFSRRKAKKI